MKNLPDKKTLFYILFALLAASGFAAQAADFDNGKKLYQAHCTRCHGSEVYVRQERIVNNLEELRQRVRQCELATEQAWFEEEIEDVVFYLDKTFYKFSNE